MGESMADQCVSCRFWADGGDLPGICLRYPPVMVDTLNERWAQPETLACDWCGEYQKDVQSPPPNTTIGTHP